MSVEQNEVAVDRRRQAFRVLGYDTPGDATAIFRGHYMDLHLPAVWSDIYQFDLQKGDVVLCTFPKCGTHWVYYILYLMTTNDFGKLPMHLQRPNFELGVTQDYLKILQNEPAPRVISTHLPVELLPKKTFENAKVVYIYRDPRDVAVSGYFHCRNMLIYPYDEPIDDYIHKFTSGQVFCGPMHKHVGDMLAAKKAGKPILMLSYDSLKRDIRSAIRKMANFIGVQLDDELLEKIVAATSVEAMRKNDDVNGKIWQHPGIWKKDAPLIRKAVSGGWRETVTDPRLAAELDNYVRQNFPPELFDGTD